mgnify:CR=1 FL=1
MNEAIRNMLESYDLGTKDSAVHAVREVLQETALLGLWRSRFFEHAAFYGGTALRILHGLDRFSEDLDFTLLRPMPEFSLSPYLAALTRELEAMGFKTTAESVQKGRASAIHSAFLKAGTREVLIAISAGERLAASIPHNQMLKIRLEVDTAPPGHFETETRFLFQPIPFSVRTCSLPDLFAGKMHAVLCRAWKNRVKGRDWYDFVWFITNHPTLHLRHLEERMRQSGDWSGADALKETAFRDLLRARIEWLDVEKARSEVLPFLRNSDSVFVWSKEFFHAAAERIQV